ncbi:BppU family phage baseplate upper protein [Bacillus cereus group sp. BY122LC]|uniref:BppU family phage baseplate upper protein n=1 Tax=Bacillus cereus group sp. BY122LC TaxID=3018085 RepID=UPI0022E069F7|nr:BppU family phage baseplate upper protein [Bacillus cereus group sp. BY122LC]MDA1861146.1 BppU family phage baseplate upper protein [Bacillus cereus group sp. BY122LC]
MKTKLILDVNKTQYAQLNSIVTGRVGDKTSNIVDVYVIDNGSPYNLTGLKVFFECTKPDSTAIRDDNGVKIIDATKGHFEYTFPVETFGASGKAKRAFFSIEKDTATRATTQDFELVSLRNALDGNILSSHYISDFEKISEEAEEVKELLDSTSKDINNAITELENKFDKAIEEGGVTPEVIVARDNYKNLNDRLGSYDTQNKAMGTFCFDDGYAEDKLTYSIFKEFGLVCSFALVRDRIFERNRVEDYRIFEKEGFTTQSHASRHLDMSQEMTESFLWYEVDRAAHELRNYGLTINGFVTPMSTFYDQQIESLKREYDYAFTVYKGTIPADGKAHVDKSHDPYRLHRVSLSRNTVDRIKIAIDKAIEEKGLLCFYDHRTGAEGENVPVDKLREILSYVKSKVDNKEFLVMNNDDAVSSFFGKTLRGYRETNPLTMNVAPSVAVTDTTALNYGKWTFSKHGQDLGEVFEIIKNGSKELDTLRISYPNGTTIGKENSLQTRIDLKGRNFNKSKNQNLHVGFDLWANQILEDGKYTFSIECRFYGKDGTYLADHKKEISVTNIQQHFDFVATPTKIRNDFDYALVYFRFKSNEILPVNFAFDVSNPIVGFGITNQVNEVENDDSNDFSAIDAFIRLDDKTVVGTPMPTKTWINYFAKNTSTATDMDEENSTFIAKVDGLYMINFGANYSVSGVTAGLKRALLEITKKGWSGDSVTRTIQHFNTPNDVIFFNASYQIYLKKGEKVYAKSFFDINDGQIIAINEQPQLRITVIPKGLI